MTFLQIVIVLLECLQNDHSESQESHLRFLLFSQCHLNGMMLNTMMNNYIHACIELLLKMYNSYLSCSIVAESVPINAMRWPDSECLYLSLWLQ